MDAARWGFKMVRHPKAMQEFSICLQAIKPIMTDTRASRDEKRKALDMMVNELSESTFNLVPIAEQIITIINMKEDVCREYPDGEAQAEGILGWLPRMKEHRELLLKAVKDARKSFRLKV